MPELPIVGKVPKGWLIAVGGGSLAVLGYLVYKHKQSAAAAATTSTTAPAAATTAGGDPYPPDGTVGDPGDPNSTDPETGMTYGDEALYGGGSALGGFVSGGGEISTGSTGGGTTGEGPGSFTSNADWASYVESQLSGIVDPATLSSAIGVYLTGRPATSTQVDLIDQAIAVGGYPPTAGPNNMPPTINQSGGGGGGQVAVPNVVGGNWTGAIHTLTAAGLKPSPAAKPRGAKDPIKSQSPQAGSQVSQGSTVHITGS